MQFIVASLALVISILIGKRGVFGIEVDLENWMRQLPEELQNLPLIHLAIPGTHNSMSYGINSNSEVAPDASDTLRSSFFDYLFSQAGKKFSKVQYIDATAQLQAGIRYFDLRVVRGGYDQQFINTIYFTHNYFAYGIANGLQDIRNFLNSHPNEVVILHFQHFYNFDENLHDILVKKIQDIYGSLICPYQRDVKSITLSSLHKSGKQVVIVYDQYRYSKKPSWEGFNIQTPWANTDNIDTLMTFLKDKIKYRNSGFYSNSFYVVQGIITPSTWFITQHLTQNFDYISKDILDRLIPFLEEKGAGAPGSEGSVNIVILDFVNLENNRFSKFVINLNYKLYDRMHHNTRNFV